MSLLIQDTAANFTADNPILLPNQIGQESDTLLMKQGDGLTAWNDLDYATPVQEAFEQVLSGDKDKVPSSYAVEQALLGEGVPTSRTLTINGNAQDLSVDRTWTLTTADVSEVTNLYFTNARALILSTFRI